MDQKDFLKEMGLSEKEAIIYQIMLKIGVSPAQKVVAETSMPRGTVYEILGQLEQKRLVENFQNEKNVTQYRVRHPFALKEYVEDQKDHIRQTETKLDSIFPDFINLYSQSQDRPGVKFYEGKKGIIMIYEEILKENKPIDSFEEKGDMIEYIPDYVPTFVKKRIKKQLPNRVISPDTNKNNKTDPDKFITAKLLPADQFPFRMDIKIAGNKVSLITFNKKNAVGILIDNQEIADNFKILFELMWNKL